MTIRSLMRCVILGMWCLTAPVLAAAGPPSQTAHVSIVIDDLGDQAGPGQRAVDLPGAVTCAFLPHTPHAVSLAERAYQQRKEVMLHLPMESHPDRLRSPGMLRAAMPREQFRETLRHVLGSVPHVSGINNHMGSLLTRMPLQMHWLMQELKHTPLFFIDSRTTAESVAARQASEQGIPHLSRDVFLDNIRTAADIRAQFERLLELAQRRGHALAIGHPYPETLSLLETELPRLAAAGIGLVPVSELIKLSMQKADSRWQQSSFPSPTVAKNSKP